MSRIIPARHSHESPVDCVPLIQGVMTWLSSAYLTVTHAWCASSIMRRVYNEGNCPLMAESSCLLGRAARRAECVLYNSRDAGKEWKVGCEPQSSTFDCELL